MKRPSYSKSAVGVIEIVGALQEGFHSLPKAYGSKVRQTGKVKDLSSGIQEGAKVRPTHNQSEVVLINI
jgi:hypothetical protein